MLRSQVTGDARVEVVVDGVVDGPSIEALRRAVLDEAALHGPVRLLVTVARFSGLTPPALWQELRSVGLLKVLERSAVVTDVGWLRTAATAEFAALRLSGRVFEDRAAALARLEG